MWFYNEVDTQYALVKGEGIILLYQPQPQVTKCDPTGRKYNFRISLSDGYGDRSLRPGPPISILAAHTSSHPSATDTTHPRLAPSPSLRCRPPSNSQTRRLPTCATIRERPRCVGFQIDARAVLDYVHTHPQLAKTQIVW